MAMRWWRSSRWTEGEPSAARSSWGPGHTRPRGAARRHTLVPRKSSGVPTGLWRSFSRPLNRRGRLAKPRPSRPAVSLPRPRLRPTAPRPPPRPRCADPARGCSPDPMPARYTTRGDATPPIHPLAQTPERPSGRGARDAPLDGPVGPRTSRVRCTGPYLAPHAIRSCMRRALPGCSPRLTHRRPRKERSHQVQTVGTFVARRTSQTFKQSAPPPIRAPRTRSRKRAT